MSNRHPLALRLFVLDLESTPYIPELTFSKQGRELQFELQTVVPCIMMMELKELLLKGTLKTVVNTSTSAFKVKQFTPIAKSAQGV
ncbi:UNVERIFIED_CONTAM: hypothetical protein ABIC26_001251 [Paenibacillus sp. PvR008]